MKRTDTITMRVSRITTERAKQLAAELSQRRGKRVTAYNVADEAILALWREVFWPGTEPATEAKEANNV